MYKVVIRENTLKQELVDTLSAQLTKEQAQRLAKALNMLFSAHNVHWWVLAELAEDNNEE